MTTPRQLTTTKEDSDAESLSSIQQNARNLNDVCFGCNGECSDVTCSSKRSSQISADVESNVADTPKRSPAHRLRDTHDPGGPVDGDVINKEDIDVALKNDTNMNVSQTESIFNEKEETNNINSENGNSSPVNSPAKPKSPKPRSRNKNGGSSKRSSKRLRSAEGSQEALDDQQRPRKVSSTCYDDSGEELDQLNDLNDLPQHARVSIFNPRFNPSRFLNPSPFVQAFTGHFSELNIQ